MKIMSKITEKLSLFRENLTNIYIYIYIWLRQNSTRGEVVY